MYNKESINPGKRSCPACGTSYNVSSWMAKNGKGFSCSRECSKRWKSDHSDKKLVGKCIVNKCNYYGPLDIKKYCRKHFSYQWRHGITEPQNLNSKPLDIEEKIATWLSGVIDCDGWVGLMGKGGTYWGAIGVGNTKEKFIDKLIQRTNIGHKTISKRKPPAKTLFMWSVSKREEVEKLALTIMPHLILKRRQSRLLMMMPPIHSRNVGRRHRIKKLMTILNKKGC